MRPDPPAAGRPRHGRTPPRSVSVRGGASLWAAVLLAAATGLAAPAAADAALAASIANLDLPAVGYSHAAQSSAGTMTLTVADTAPGAGWNVTILSSAFAYSGEFAGLAIPAANFSITDAAPPALVSGQAIDPTGGPKVPASGATGSLDVARKTIQAEAGFGGGTYTQALGVSLTIPAWSRAGTYGATLTVTISAGP